MNNTIALINQSRKAFSYYFKLFDVEQLNAIPEGMGNNILWNAGHVVAVSQGLTYARSGLDMMVTDSFYQRFKKDSLPEVYTEEDVKLIKKLMKSTSEQLVNDYNANRFASYNSFRTMLGAELSNIDEALLFDLYHIGYHVGVCQTIIKRLKS